MHNMRSTGLAPNRKREIMKNSEIHALRLLRKKLVVIGHAATEKPSKRATATLKKTLNEAHGITFLLLAPYSNRAQS